MFAEIDLKPRRRAKSTVSTVDLDRLLDKLGRGAPDFAAVYRAVAGFVTEASTRYGHTEAICTGTLTALPRIAMLFSLASASPILPRARELILFVYQRIQDDNSGNA